MALVLPPAIAKVLDVLPVMFTTVGAEHGGLHIAPAIAHRARALEVLALAVDVEVEVPASKAPALGAFIDEAVHGLLLDPVLEGPWIGGLERGVHLRQGVQ